MKFKTEGIKNLPLINFLNSFKFRAIIVKDLHVLGIQIGLQVFSLKDCLELL